MKVTCHIAMPYDHTVEWFGHQLMWYFLPLFTGFFTSQVVQAFFHQQYDI